MVAARNNLMQPRLLILESSHRTGRVALALGERVLGERILSEARRHTRDLAPFIRELLAEQNWNARDLSAVIVSRGPGSYTGLRVGLMSAKTLAYATGCRLLGVSTFAAIARQAPAAATRLDVLADAQQDKVYVQGFTRSAGQQPWQEREPLRIVTLAAWRVAVEAGAWVSGPALELHEGRMPAQVHLAPREAWLPHSQSLLELGLDRWRREEQDDPFALEPLYLRPSNAEEKWAERAMNER